MWLLRDRFTWRCDSGIRDYGPVHNGANHVPKVISDHDPLPDWVRDLNYVRSQALQRPIPIMKRICALRGNVLFLLRRLTHAWLQRAFPKCTRTIHVPKELCVKSSEWSGFLGGSWSKTPLFAFQKPDLKELCVHKGENQAFKSGKGQNNDPKRLSEHHLLFCEQAIEEFEKETNEPWVVFVWRPPSQRFQTTRCSWCQLTPPSCSPAAWFCLSPVGPGLASWGGAQRWGGGGGKKRRCIYVLERCNIQVKNSSRIMLICIVDSSYKEWWMI